MAVRSLTEAIDNLYTTTWENRKSEIRDQIFDGTPFWFWLRQHGGLEKVEGGRFLTEPLRYAKSERVRFVQRGSTMPLSDNQFLTAAQDEWRYLADSIVRFGVDDQQNRGKNQIISLVNSKLDQSRDSLTDKLEIALAGAKATTEGADDADAFLGLRDLVADDPTASATIHGIAQNTHTWWRNQFKSMAGSSFTTNGVSEMNKMLNKCSKNLATDRPDIILGGQQPYEMYWEETLEQRRVTNKTLGDAGFENVQFRGMPFIWSPQVASDDISATPGRIYFLNTRFLKFKYDPMVFFDMTEWKSIPNQINDRAAQIMLAGNLMTGRRRVHGVIFGIDTV